MSDKKFAIVHFYEEDSVAVVHKSWIKATKDGITCFWPPKGAIKGTAVCRAVKKGIPPCGDWNQFAAKILKETDNYKSARKKCEKAVNATHICSEDLDTTDVESKRKIRPPSRLEESNSDNDASNHWESDQSKPKRKKLFLQHSTPPPVVPEMPNTQERSSVTSQETDVQASALHQLPTERERPSTILLLERIWGQVKQNSVMLQSLHRQFVEGQIPSTSSVEHFNLPIDSFEDFDRVESLLAEKSQARVFISYLETIGGITAKDVISMMLSKLLTCELATNCNWMGKGHTHKTGMHSSQLAKAVIDAAKKSGIKKAESICEIKKWLKNASDREGGRLKRMKNKLDKERKDEATRRQLYFMNFDSSSTSDDNG
ncbi:unnamed protein product [Clavelina lepadiformis]|uniref:DUF4806 domain-containing protein n=1 Tax=Clavelina lepadiformis TaxID=159417 RepID=A0ABP0FMT2_CLALP